MNDDDFWVVVASREVPCGSVIESAERARQLEGSGALLLRFNPHALDAGGAIASTAFQFRSYGAKGRVFEGTKPMRDCFMPIFIQAPSVRVEWMAKLSSNASASNGTLRLDAGPLAGGPSCSVQGSNGIDFGKPGAFFERTSIVRGEAIVLGIPNTFAIVCLRGAVDAVRVEWFAMTVLSPE